MDTELTVTLSKPIKLGEIEYAELKLSEPTMKELRTSGKAGDGLDQLAMLIHLNARVPMAVVDSLCQRDIKVCDAFFARFAAVSPPTPET